MTNREYYFWWWAWLWLFLNNVETMVYGYAALSFLVFPLIGYFAIACDNCFPKVTNWLNKKHSYKLY